MKNIHLCIKRIVSVIMSVMVVMVCVHFPVKSAGSENEDINFQELADQLGYLVNEARMEAGLNPLYMVPYLNDIATARSVECMTYFSHDRVITDAGGNRLYYDAQGEPFGVKHMFYPNMPWANVSENIANTMNTAEKTFDQFKNSPKHWKAIMNPNITHMGMGVAFEANPIYDISEEYPEGYATKHWYWTQVFIKIDDDPEYFREALGWQWFTEDGHMAYEGQYIPDMYQIEPTGCGDINGDGVVDCFDLVLLKQYLNKQVTLNPLQVEACDICYDGVVTFIDAIFLKQFIIGAGGYKELPVRLW